RALAALDRPDAVAVAVTAMVPSMCAVDRRGVPITPGLLYGDARGRGARATTDSPATSGEAIEFVRWTAGRAPDARGYWPAQAVANYALAGEDVVDTTTAFTSYPLFTGPGRDEQLLAGCRARPDQMPRFESNNVAIGKVGDAILG